MSRHTIRKQDGKGNLVTVVLGYDRPLDCVFCTVTREEDADVPVYSNLDDQGAGLHQQDVSYFRGALARLGIEIPERMFFEVEMDQLRRIGNRDVDHTPLA